MTNPPEPYGDFVAVDPDCSRVRELVGSLGRDLTEMEAQRHRAVCDHCMMLAVLSSEIVASPGTEDSP